MCKRYTHSDASHMRSITATANKSIYLSHAHTHTHTAFRRLTVDLQGDGDVGAAGHVDRVARVRPGVLRQRSLQVQAAIAAQERSRAGLHL